MKQNLPQLINRKLLLIQELEDSDGEISTKTEGQLEVINAQIRENADSYVDYRQSLDASIDKYKQLIKAFVAIQEKKKSRLDEFLKFAIEKIGPITTPFSSIKVQSRHSTSVVITDFDFCVKNYPDAVTIKTMDNCRTIYISKEELRRSSLGGEGAGFEIVEKESKFIAARQKANIKDNTNAIAD